MPCAERVFFFLIPHSLLPQHPFSSPFESVRFIPARKPFFPKPRFSFDPLNWDPPLVLRFPFFRFLFFPMHENRPPSFLLMFMPPFLEELHLNEPFPMIAPPFSSSPPFPAASWIEPHPYDLPPFCATLVLLPSVEIIGFLFPLAPTV